MEEKERIGNKRVERFEMYFNEFRSGIFKSSLDHWIETGKASGSLFQRIIEWDSAHATQVGTLINTPERQEKELSAKQSRITELEEEVKGLVEHTQQVHDAAAKKFLELKEENKRLKELAEAADKIILALLIFPEHWHVSDFKNISHDEDIKAYNTLKIKDDSTGRKK